MNRTFYVTPKPDVGINKKDSTSFKFGYSYPVLDIMTTELGGNIRLVIAGGDGQILHRRTNEVGIVGFEPKPYGDWNDIVYSPEQDLIDHTPEDIPEEIIKPTTNKGKK